MKLKGLLAFAFIFMLLFINAGTAQEGNVPVSTGDSLTYRIADMFDTRGPLTFYDVAVAINDTYTVTVVDTDTIDPVIDLEIEVNSETVEIQHDARKLGYFSIPDWDYWEETLVSAGGVFEYDEDGNIIIAYAYLELDSVVYIGFLYNPQGIVLAEYIEFSLESNQDVPYFYIFSVLESDDTNPGLAYNFNKETGFTKSKTYEYKMTLFDTDQDLALHRKGTDSLYVLEGDHFTVEPVTSPNNKDEISVRVTAGSENIVVTQKLTTLGNYFLYADSQTWIEFIDDWKDNLKEGEFVDYTIGEEFVLHYLYQGDGASFEFTMVYSTHTWVLQSLEAELEESGGYFHYAFEIVNKNGDGRRITIFNPFILFTVMIGGTILRKYSKNIKLY